MLPTVQVFPEAHQFHIDQQVINVFGNVSKEEKDLIVRLNPITDASHKRDRATSPPDSACFPGTRIGPIKGIRRWVDARIGLHSHTTHIQWFHGFAGSGKSAISLEIARIYAGRGRLLASFFFYKGSRERSTMNRFAATLASQLVAALPPVAPFIDAALKVEPGLLRGGLSLATQLEQLVYDPFRAATKRGLFIKALSKGPFLIVVDGLDECEEKQRVEEFISCTLNFFERHPSTPLRVLIASRIEKHIQAHLKTEGVLVTSLDAYPSDLDIQRFMEASFLIAAKQDPILQAYIRAHGQWPLKDDMRKLVAHIDGSFVLASTILKFIFQEATEEDPSTPMDRLPLAVEMNGLDGLYIQTLSRSQRLPHFRDIISTVAFLFRPLSIIDIANLLGIETFEVVRVLVNLQAIIHIPGVDEGIVTMCHASLRDFLTTYSRAAAFFVAPSFHLYLSYYSFSSAFDAQRDMLDGYGRHRFSDHWQSFAQSEAIDFIQEIELFKARQPLFFNGAPLYHAFLCSLLFYNFLTNPQSDFFALTECVKELALAMESPDNVIEEWIKQDLHYYFRPRRIRFTEQAYEAMRDELERATIALTANARLSFLGLADAASDQHFSCTLGQVRASTPLSRMLRVDALNPELPLSTVDYNPGPGLILKLSGISIYSTLRWIMARAAFLWNKAETAMLRPPIDLELSVFTGPHRIFAIGTVDEAYLRLRSIGNKHGPDFTTSESFVLDER